MNEQRSSAWGVDLSQTHCSFLTWKTLVKRSIRNKHVIGNAPNASNTSRPWYDGYGDCIEETGVCTSVVVVDAAVGSALLVLPLLLVAESFEAAAVKCLRSESCVSSKLESRLLSDCSTISSVFALTTIVGLAIFSGGGCGSSTVSVASEPLDFNEPVDVSPLFVSAALGSFLPFL